MANVAHSTLTGSDLHEPRGVGAATSGQVYIADGVGSGAWSSASTALTLTGQIADFWTLAPPSGWLECDGSNISRTTFATLFAATTVQQSGTRTNGSAIITGLSSTTNMRVGYYVGGTGITNGTKILTVDSATQITLDANATSSGTSTVIISIGALGDGSTTFTLPDTVTAGRYRRSRYSTNNIGLTQTDLIKNHTHSGTTGVEDAIHTHTGSGTTSGQSVNHTHSVPISGGAGGFSGSGNGAVNPSSGTSGANSVDHTHTYNFTSAAQSATHHHPFTSGNPDSSLGGTETRPITMIVLTCIRT